MIDAVRAWHAAQPLSPGLDIEEARSRVGADIHRRRGGVPVLACPPGPRLFRLLVDELERDRLLAREGNMLRLPSHRVEVAGADHVLANRILEALTAVPLAPPDMKTLAETLKVDRAKLLPLLRAMEKQKQIVTVSQDLYFAAEAIAKTRDDLLRVLADGSSLTPAAFRDRYQTSRKYAIPLLEYFDRLGVTVRIGETRKLRAKVR